MFINGANWIEIDGLNGPFTVRDFANCQAKRNKRSGFRSQEMETLRIYGGNFDENDASGIQIETQTYDVINGAEMVTSQ